MSGETDFSYPGNELEVFAHARNWKRYWSGLIAPYVQGDVLELGAGLGVNTLLLRRGGHRRWVALEPDPRLYEHLRACLKLTSPLDCEIRQGTLEKIGGDEVFDTILYIDVLEHIKDDVAELKRAARRLREGGRIIVLAPAHGWLFSKFDAAIGHHRRYTRRSLKAAGEAAGNLRAEWFAYLDACGLFASLANRLLLRQTSPSLRQIQFWDGVLVPVSRLCDPLFLRRFGKSILGIWKRTG